MKIMEKDKIFKALICIGIVLCSVFLVGTKNVNAYSQSDYDTVKSEFSSLKGKAQFEYAIGLYNKAAYKIKIYTYNKDSYTETDTYSLFWSDVPFKVKGYNTSNYAILDDKNVPLKVYDFSFSTDALGNYYNNFLYTSYIHQVSGNSVNIDSFKQRISYSSFDLYYGNDLVFRVPLVKVAEQLTPTIQGDTKTIVVTAVGLLGLLILSMRLLPGLKTFFRG